jgi:alpha/beta superfamily hydrolase
LISEICQASKRPEPDGSVRIELATDDVPVSCRAFCAENGDSAVIWVSGVAGGWGGPAGGLYPRLGRQLAQEGITSLEVAYRHPGQLRACIDDVLTALQWLESEGRKRAVLAGHSFGGAVAIQAAGMSTCVIAVAAVSSQLHGAANIGQLRGRPVLLIHGCADEILPDLCSRELYQLAGQPKKLILYPHSRHGLDECRESLDADLLAWLREVLPPGGEASGAPGASGLAGGAREQGAAEKKDHN